MYYLQVLLLLLYHWCYSVSGDDGCRSPQYLEMGESGTIICTFREGFYGVFWYNSTTTENERPFLYYKDGEKTGRGYSSGEFDVHQNGSLIINRVSMQHDHTFMVAVITDRDEGTAYHQEVIIVVTVKPEQDRPFIVGCMFEANEICYVQSDKTFDLTCYVRDSRPSIPIMWVKRTLNTDTNISFVAFSSVNGIMESTFANITYTFSKSECLVLLACKTVEETANLKTQEALIVAECLEANHTTNPQVRHAELDSSVALECTKSMNMLFVWKKYPAAIGGQDAAALAVTVKLDSLNNCISNPDVTNGGTLFIGNISYTDTSVYTCVFGNGTNWNMNSFNVIVHAKRLSVTFGIEGCHISGECQLPATEEGSLTCRILGVRPIVQLTWSIMTNDTKDYIFFFKETNTIIQHDSGYDISLKLSYIILDSKRAEITVKCKVSEQYADMFPFEEEVMLTISQDEPTEPTYSTTTTVENPPIAMLVTLAFYTMVIIWAIVCYFVVSSRVFKICRNDQWESIQLEEEMEAMIPAYIDVADAKTIMKKELRERYRKLYTNISPFLTCSEAPYSIETIFVNCPISVLRPKEKLREEPLWQPVESYHDLFRSDIFKSNRLIVEAYPGYGKSTLALKLAYDWSEKKSNSFAKDEELFILLPSHQLGKISSFYQAVRKILLREDCRLNENNIRDIFQSCNSLCIVFDDFEEYPEKQIAPNSDILKIINGDIFRTYKVIVTTRSFKFTDDHDIRGHKVRLRGFDHAAKKAYMNQVFQDDTSIIDTVLLQLQQNPALLDLCEIPLFFTAYAHMPREHDQFQKLNTITKVVSYMMQCFERHAGERQKRPSQSRQKMDLNEYHKLDKIAFESLTGDDQLITKEHLLARIGDQLFNKCIRMGILIEEQQFFISDNRDCREQENYTSKHMVRFHHKILCEWHAAYYLVKKIKETRTIADLNTTLEKLDPLNFPIVHLFVCGLYPNGISKITKLLRKKPETSTLIMRGIYEGTGHVSDIRHSLISMNKKPVIFYNRDSRLMQNTVLKLLEICSDNQIDIAAVRCYNCIDHEKCTANNLTLESGASIPVLLTVKELMIYCEGKKVNSKDVASIFKYTARCSNLKNFLIFGQMMPLTYKRDDSFVQLQERNVKVSWTPITEQEYTLNLQSCKWQLKGSIIELNEAEYSELVEDFNEFWNLDDLEGQASRIV